MTRREETFRVGRHDVPVEPRVSPKVRVGTAPGCGKGLFAAAPVAAGELVLVWGGPSYVGPEEAAAARAAGLGTMQWDDDLFSRETDDDHPAFAINHSCDPDVGFADAFHLTARQAIAPGEELTIDYAMLPGDAAWRSEWTCACGAADCRGTITGEDWRIPDLARRYRGRFVPFVARRIAEAGADAP